MVCRRSEAASLFCLAGGFTALRPSSRPLSESQIPTPPMRPRFSTPYCPKPSPALSTRPSDLPADSVTTIPVNQSGNLLPLNHNRRHCIYRVFSMGSRAFAGRHHHRIPWTSPRHAKAPPSPPCPKSPKSHIFFAHPNLAYKFTHHGTRLT